MGGTLHYDLRYSETTQFGNGQDGEQWSTTSGDASYANTNQRLPFSMQYGGGYAKAWNGPPSAGNVFQHLSLSQGKVWRAWNLTASDNVSYTFETPTTGFSGVPGYGGTDRRAGLDPLARPDGTDAEYPHSGQLYDLTIGHRLDFATSLNVGGSSGQMRYIDKNGQNSTR